MKKILERFIPTKCEVIVDLEQIPEVLKVLDQQEITKLDIGSCAWRDASNKWYVMFTATRKQLVTIEGTLKKGKFNEILILKNTNSWVKVEKLA